MGIGYIVVGGLCLLLGLGFTAAYLIKPRYDCHDSTRFEADSCRKLGDHTYLTWNNEQPSTAVATGRDRF